jgi:CRISPR-associated endonuclease/helicase Cas3
MTLLAKSPRPRELSLPQHTEDVMNAAEWMFGPAEKPRRLGEQWLRFFRLKLDDWGRFHANLLASAAFHDWGKATDSFQNCIRRGDTQLIRHEHFSGLILAVEEMRSWLATRNDLEPDLVLSAVLTHHLKTRHAEQVTLRGGGNLIRLFVDDPDFIALVEQVRGRLGLTGLVPSLPEFWSFDGSPRTTAIESFRKRIETRLRAFTQRLRQEESLCRLNRAVRAALIAADAAASGLYRQGHNIELWLAEAFCTHAPLS